MRSCEAQMDASASARRSPALVGVAMVGSLPPRLLAEGDVGQCPHLLAQLVQLALQAFGRVSGRDVRLIRETSRRELRGKATRPASCSTLMSATTIAKIAAARSTCSSTSEPSATPGSRSGTPSINDTATAAASRSVRGRASRTAPRSGVGNLNRRRGARCSWAKGAAGLGHVQGHGSVSPSKTPNAAPCGSASTAIRPRPIVSGGNSTDAPAASALRTDASASATWK